MIKEGGVFICQTCGCKYSVEEARKMMVEGTVEVTGTVQIDSTAEKEKKIESYLQMCQTAFEGNDTNAVVEYSDKILELDQDNYQAWRYRALSAGWHSSLNSMKTAQVITAAKRALQLAPYEERSKVATEIYQQGKAQIIAHLKTALGMPGSLATIVKKYECIHKVMTAWVSLVLEIPYLPEELIKKEIDDCKTVDSDNSLRFSSVRATADCNNNKTKYSAVMEKGAAIKLEKEKKEKEDRIKEYWDNHSDIKKSLDDEKASLQDQIKELTDQIQQLPEVKIVDELEAQIEAYKKEKNSLGMFKGKEKKALQEKIDALISQLNDAKTAKSLAKVPFEEKIGIHNKRITEIDAELKKER